MLIRNFTLVLTYIISISHNAVFESQFFIIPFLVVHGWPVAQAAFLLTPNHPKIFCVGVLWGANLKYHINFSVKFLTHLNCYFRVPITINQLYNKLILEDYDIASRGLRYCEESLLYCVRTQDF